MNEKHVVFLDTPVQGQPARFTLNGQTGQSSPACCVHTNPDAPNWFCVDTQSGSRYVGYLAAQRTVMGAGSTQMFGLGAVPAETISPPAPYPNTAAYPPGLNWGAFLLCPFWGIAHNVWVALIALVPAAGWVVPIVMLLKGNEMAWQNRAFRSYEEFHSVQRAWLIWGIVLNSLWILGWAALWFAWVFMGVAALSAMPSLTP